jgi:general secretion pathway protein D
MSKIPLVGGLFRSRKTEKFKTNLLVFFRPKILRDRASISLETNSKYNQMRQFQQIDQSSGIPLMPGLDRPMLPELSEQDIANEQATTEPAQDEATQSE